MSARPFAEVVPGGPKIGPSRWSAASPSPMNRLSAASATISPRFVSNLFMSALPFAVPMLRSPLLLNDVRVQHRRVVKRLVARLRSRIRGQHRAIHNGEQAMAKMPDLRSEEH